MQKIMKILAGSCIVIFMLFFAYVVIKVKIINAPRSMTVSERKQMVDKENEALKSIFIFNDIGSTVVAEFVNRIGELVTSEVGEDGIILSRSGHLRVFVPEKRGWYTVEYEYPYPLTKKDLSFLPFVSNRRCVRVWLSSLINSINTGEVEYTIPDMIGTEDEEWFERGVVKDIKVTFESGELKK